MSKEESEYEHCARINKEVQDKFKEWEKMSKEKKTCKHSIIQGMDVNCCVNCHKSVTQILKEYKHALSVQKAELKKKLLERVEILSNDIGEIDYSDMKDAIHEIMGETE